MIQMAYQGWRWSPRWFMSILVAFEMQGHIAYSDDNIINYYLCKVQATASFLSFLHNLTIA